MPGTDPVLDHAYDAFGDRVELALTDATGTVDHAWGFDDLARLTGATFDDGSAVQALAFDYFANDDLEQITHGNGVVTDLTYLDEGSVDTITVSAGSELHRLDYAVDAVLNVDAIEEWVGGTKLLPSGGSGGDPSFDYGYDAVYRLDQATYPDAFGLPTGEAFAYDGAGNRDDAGSPGSYTYDANNRIETSHGRGYTFDADGNLVEIDDGQLVPTTLADLTFDRTNRLQEYDEVGGPTTTYRYDPFGRRVMKTVDDGTPETTWYLWDGDQLLGEYDASGNRLVRYAYAGGFAPVQVAYDDGSGGEDIYDVHTDHLDTPRMLTDENDTPVWRSAHEAYGAAQPDEDPDADTNPVTFNLRFPGQYYDAETGLYYNRFRYYDPQIGRYVSADPIGQEDEVNVFQYALDNPLNYFDPLGLRTTRPQWGSGGGGGGMMGGGPVGRIGGGGSAPPRTTSIGVPPSNPGNTGMGLPGPGNPAGGGPGRLPPGGKTGVIGALLAYLGSLFPQLPPQPGLVVDPPLPPLPCDPTIATCIPQPAPVCQ